MPASSAAITGTCRAWRTMTYWASQLTTAAAAARTARAAMALRSQARPVSGVVDRWMRGAVQGRCGVLGRRGGWPGPGGVRGVRHVGPGLLGLTPAER